MTGRRIAHWSTSDVNSKMGKKIVAARDLPAGHVIQPEDIVFKSLGDGLPPCELDKVPGRTTLCELKADDNLTFEVLGGGATWPWPCPEVLEKACLG